MVNPPTLYLIDAHSYVYRAYHAIKHLSTSDGLPTHAVFGVTNMLLKVLRERKPDYLAMVFDSKGPTFRHNMLETYKAHRPAMPEDLSVQLPYIKDVIRAMAVTSIELEGYEADDLIATIARHMASESLRVVIISGDKDLTQLLSPFILIWDPMRDRWLDLARLHEEYGVNPEQIIDVMALSGDAVDNVPGVPGVGPKTALDLIKRYGSIEVLLNSLQDITKPKLRENLASHKEQTFLSKELVRLDSNVPVETELSNLEIGAPNQKELKRLFTRLEFVKFLKELEETAPEMEEDSSVKAEEFKSGFTCNLVEEKETLDRFLSEIEQTGSFRVATVGLSRDPVRADAGGIAFSFGEGAHTKKEPQEIFYLPYSSTIWGEPIQKILADPRLGKTGYDLKYDIVLLERNNLSLSGPLVDLMIAAYLINPVRRPTLSALAKEYLGIAAADLKELQEFRSPGCKEPAAAGCTALELIDRLAEKVLPEVEARGVSQLFYEVEMPLVRVLADMERVGVKLDTALLQKISGELESQLIEIRRRIVSLAGCDFNINSHKQLGDLLFGKLNLPRFKKTRKTGNYSTGANILEKLSLYHPLPAQILAYRNLSKLKTTYLDALPKLVNPETGRLHSSYNQAITATGRLSSSEPNIQNIPIRSEDGRRIRHAFVTEPAWSMISFDYSQIELRILAHFARDNGLRKAFERGADIHTETAAQLFNTFPQMITPEMRRIAKTINFGVAYGMSSFGLSQELRIGRKEAQAFIDAYFTRYKGVKEFMEEAIANARETGCARTLLNRCRPIPDINSRNKTVRQFAERTAINTPIQGTAADIMKIAMIKVHSALQEGWKGRIVMQVHDELIIEAPDEEVDSLIPLVRENMEKAVELSVPILVNIRSGRNWGDLE